MSKCGLCGNFLCKWHKEFLLTCSQCRDVRCSNCVMLKSSISLLMKLADDDDGRNYLQNFIFDYFNLRDTLLKNYFNTEKLNETKERIKTFDIKVYHKSEKNRSQVVIKTLEDCNKIQYISQRRKCPFYKKNCFFIFSNSRNELV